MDWVDIVLTPFIVVIWGGQLLIKKAPKRIYFLLVTLAKKSAAVSA